MKQWKYPVNPAVLPSFSNFFFWETTISEILTIKIQDKLDHISIFLFENLSTSEVLIRDRFNSNDPHFDVNSLKKKKEIKKCQF
jgi:hypothetical protein